MSPGIHFQNFEILVKEIIHSKISNAKKLLKSKVYSLSCDYLNPVP